MLDPARFRFCTEFYVVEKSIEVVARIAGEDRRIRIDALVELGPAVPYSTRAYIEKEISVQSLPQNDVGPSDEPVSVRAWIVYDLPLTRSDSADRALAQALEFLRHRV